MTVPSVLVAGGDVVCSVVVIANREMECIGTGATLLVDVIEGVDARSGVSVVMPNMGIAGVMIERLV